MATRTGDTGGRHRPPRRPPPPRAPFDLHPRARLVPGPPSLRPDEAFPFGRQRSATDGEGRRGDLAWAGSDCGLPGARPELPQEGSALVPTSTGGGEWKGKFSWVAAGLPCAAICCTAARFACCCGRLSLCWPCLPLALDEPVDPPRTTGRVLPCSSHLPHGIRYHTRGIQQCLPCPDRQLLSNLAAPP